MDFTLWTKQNLTIRLADARLAKAGAKNISPIVSINGMNVEDYLSEFSMQSNSQDRDAK